MLNWMKRAAHHLERRRGVATTTGMGTIQRKRKAIDELDIEGLRQRLHRMSNPELLMFGVTTKCLCALDASPDSSPSGGVLVQLREAREEWKKRNPSLPLSESF